MKNPAFTLARETSGRLLILVAGQVVREEPAPWRPHHDAEAYRELEKLVENAALLSADQLSDNLANRMTGPGGAIYPGATVRITYHREFHMHTARVVGRHETSPDTFALVLDLDNGRNPIVLNEDDCEEIS